MIVVTHFGLHWATGDIPFLIQAGGAQNLIDPELPCPFVPLVRPKKIRCPHNIDLATATAERPDWVDDPLARIFHPIPLQDDEPSAYVLVSNNDAFDRMVPVLSRLCSSTEPFMKPVWWKLAMEHHYVYRVTNLTPLVWSHATVNDTPEVHRHIDMAKVNRRRLLILARENLPLFDSSIQYISTSLTEVPEAPLEEIGAGILRNHMQDACSSRLSGR